MKQGTTPTIPLVVDTDLTDWTVYVTFANGSHKNARGLLTNGRTYSYTFMKWTSS